MSECTHDCANCGSKGSCEEMPKDALHELSHVNKVIAIVSGKGGVGKSLVTGLLASKTAKLGKKVAILDADITGPSIPKMFGIKGSADGDDSGFYPRESKGGIRVISSNLLLPEENAPIIWRGPMIAGLVKQFWSNVIWGDVDYMYIDMPPGTGDVPLTVFQSIKVDGIIVVTSPQELVSMIVEKAVKMANMMKIPILGVIENLSYIKCPDCGKEFAVFGESKIDEVATDFDLKLLGRLPIEQRIAKACDQGKLEEIEMDYLDSAINAIL